MDIDLDLWLKPVFSCNFKFSINDDIGLICFQILFVDNLIANEFLLNKRMGEFFDLKTGPVREKRQTADETYFLLNLLFLNMLKNIFVLMFAKNCEGAI